MLDLKTLINKIIDSEIDYEDKLIQIHFLIQLELFNYIRELSRDLSKLKKGD